MSARRCSRCGEVKPASAFHRDRSRRDGLFLRCKACRKAKRPAPAPAEDGTSVSFREGAQRLVVKNLAGNALALRPSEALEVARRIETILGGQRGDKLP